MKLRITKGRIAWAIVLLPVLYLLNAGPMIYCCEHFGVPSRKILFTVFQPAVDMMNRTPLGEAYRNYLGRWYGQPVPVPID
jgi:hypothetical protein